MLNKQAREALSVLFILIGIIIIIALIIGRKI